MKIKDDHDMLKEMDFSNCVLILLTLDQVLFSWLYVSVAVFAFPLVELSVDSLGTQRKERDKKCFSGVAN